MRAGRPDRDGPATVRGPWHLRLSLDRLAELRDPEFRVLLILEGHCSEERPYCWPKLPTLAEETGKAPRTLWTVLDSLEERGWVERVYGSRRELIGVVLLKRALTGAVAADDPARLESARKALHTRAQASRKRPARTARRPAEIGQPSRPFSATLGQPISATSPTPPIEDEPSQSEPYPLNDRLPATDRPSPTGGNGSPVRWTEADVEALARKNHARLYGGMSPSIADRDWANWQKRYLTFARLVLCGRLNLVHVEIALWEAWKPGTNVRGKRFLAALRDALHGKASVAAPPRSPHRAPAPAPAPAPPSATPQTGPPPGGYYQSQGPPRRYRGETAPAVAKPAPVIDRAATARERLAAYQAELETATDPDRRKLLQASMVPWERVLARTEAAAPAPAESPPEPSPATIPFD